MSADESKGPGLVPNLVVLQSRRQPLDAIFAPRTIAVVGATEQAESVGKTMLENLLGNPFGRTIFPVNPHRAEVLGVKAYARLADVPEPIDLAIVATPAAVVPEVIGDCASAGVRGAIVVSAGFKEVGAEGAELERRVLEQARRGRVRLIGPNCLGVMRPFNGLNATFARRMALPGGVGFLSQSGALCDAILDWSLRENVGFSAFVSVGSMIDVGWGDLIDYLGDDPHTQCIVIYMESIGDARAFLSAAREVALTKPIIVLKAGRSEEAARAAASHTGAVTGNNDVLDAAFRRCGVLRVDTLAEMFAVAEILSKQPRPRGPRLAIVTNAGGPGVLATDALLKAGGELAHFSNETMATLDACLPPPWSRGNPIDVLGDASAERYTQAVEAAVQDRATDGLLVILTPQALSEPTRTAESLKAFARVEGKPVLASWMGGADVAAGVEILNRAGIPTFVYPDTAARVFHAMWRSTYNLRALYETPTSTDDSHDTALARAAAEAVGAAVRGEGRTILTELESKRLLDAYAIPTVETRFAHDEAEAVEVANALGYPVALKLASETITHKSAGGGVRLDLPDADAVRHAFAEIATAVRERAGAGLGAFQGVTVQPMIRRNGFELIVGSSLDPQFGPVLLFGSGGRHVEVLHDWSLALPPLNTTLARRMMEPTRAYAALKASQGRDLIDSAQLEQLLVRFSRLVVEQPWIKEIDINPLLASREGFLALDARVIAHGPEVREGQWPRLAIRPYPTQYAVPWTAPDGTALLIRPIRPEDEPSFIQFHERLSEQSVSFRYFHAMKLGRRVAHDRLTRICFNDYDREMALVADYQDPATGAREILGVSRLMKQHGRNEAEFALLVVDRFQGRGLGTELLRRLVQVGRDEGLDQINADILPQNRPMLLLCKRLGFSLVQKPGDDVVRAILDLRGSVKAPARP
ncbi:bifunctional acetate--CoA ligase family protein/GNAT family N-acetyltransferase [Singulisphaera acidiphila]|uniref:Acyl-CoA synthetase (NDP forming) n=3 Tax=Singulisphaera acidiphila TaxID=466153 RepID=L0DH85_SINAD|nr:bifunctional acetate--CoA ligase family protein/GNAT family N-acetyltransferase [Singulisphaera acidiphila]AGA28178.1 acyl-CoA synthetase (NDP forming) [Singulisphaera acidiphila DSM 18658]